MTTELKHDWKFCKADFSDAQQPNFDDSAWRTVRVPHDYAIEGPFHPENDKQVQSVIADGIKKPIVHIARTGGLPICDTAWYRRHFSVAAETERVFIEFDGAMSNSTVYVNGKECGGRPYGYSSFSVDVTEACQKESENLLAVRLAPEGSASRWYSGAGIYRNVRLVEKKASYFPYCPAYITTEVTDGAATVNCTLSVASSKPYTLKVSILDQAGNTVAKQQLESADAITAASFTLDHFQRWHILDAYQYTLTAELWVDGMLQDSYQNKFGIRTIQFDANKGFFLNGENVKLKGVCMHHDLGALGAAMNVSGMRRQLEKLIEMGTNALRCTHNPPAPELLDLCDEYGIVAIDEAFDEWKAMKISNSYGKYFDKWAETDLTDMVKRDRNHPCVIMWSLGNEILEQGRADGWQVVKYLNDICKKVDPTRPTTCGFNNTIKAFENHLCDYVDLVGINYKPHLYEQLHEQYPNMILYGSETSSCISSRGEYFLPAELENPPIMRENYQINSYDLASPPWAYYPEREFAAQEKYDFVFGEFVWTGFDYIGEPTPYREEWPSRSSYFGIFDLVGFEKDRYYSYKAQWTDKPVLHLFPHWNWNEGDVVSVHCYSSVDAVELFLNGKSLGVQRKNNSDDLHQYRLIWENIPFVAGELKAAAVDHPELIDIVRTAGAPAQLVLTPEEAEIPADGDTLVYVKCAVLDANGVLCPTANLDIDFTVEGAGEYLAADNGDATDTRTFHEPHCKLYNSKCMAILRSINGQTGVIRCTATAQDLPGVTACTEITAK